VTGDLRFAKLQRVVPDVSRETFDDLAAFESLFRKWAPAINLAAPSALGQLWDRHIIDSAQLFAIRPQAEMWLDLGSGGGFPGLVTAILTKPNPMAEVDLVESAGKKAAFLRTVAAELSLRVRVHHARIEDVARTQALRPDVVTARALAPLPKLLALAEPWLTHGATGLFQKGRDYAREVAESRDDWSFDLLEHRSVTEPGAAILEISSLKRLA
jgi:16S rRNA (guanine527-N7)-methyltransferase